MIGSHRYRARSQRQSDEEDLVHIVEPSQPRPDSRSPEQCRQGPRPARASLPKSLGVEPAALRAQFHNVEHHRAHLASAFFVSPFEEAAILSVDGMGDFVSTMWGTGRGNHFDVGDQITFRIRWAMSIRRSRSGWASPSMATKARSWGWRPMASPGIWTKCARSCACSRTARLNWIWTISPVAARAHDDVGWRQSPRWGDVLSISSCEVFGEPRDRGWPAALRDHGEAARCGGHAASHAGRSRVCAGAQVQRETGQKALCLAGGVALNSSFNGKMLPNTEFEDIYIHPAAGDAGTALGACYYIYHQVLGQPRTFVMHDAYTGPQASPTARSPKALDRSWTCPIRNSSRGRAG